MCRSLCKDLPSATFQYRERIIWRWLSQDGCIEATILYCRNLDHHKLLQLASFLTSCAVSFRFNSANTIVIDTAGLDSSILVRLMHYAEVPIPTTMKQGAFSLSIKGNGLSTGDRNFLSFDLKIGRIGALPSVPVQIRCTSVEGLITLPLHQSTIGRWIKKELSGFNISEVVMKTRSPTLFYSFVCLLRMNPATPKFLNTRTRLSLLTMLCRMQHLLV